MNRLLSLFATALLLNPIITHAREIDGEWLDWEYKDMIGLDEYWGMSLGPNPSYSQCFPIPETSTGTDTTYLFNDGFDDSRDVVAFYVHDPGTDTVYFRVDFFDLKTGAEANGGLDVYITMDTMPNNGSQWMPDFTDVETDHPWEVAVALYDTDNHVVYNQAFLTHTDVIEGPRFDATQDAVEFALPRTFLEGYGWDPNTVNFQVFTTKDGTENGAGEIGGTGGGTGNSDIADALTDDDRGFGDGVLNGAINMSSPRPGRGKYVIMMHGNQSFNTEEEIITRIDHGRDPKHPVIGSGFFRALDTAENYGIPLELHLSGVLTHAIEWSDPAFNDRMERMRNEGLVDFVGGIYAEHIMPFYAGNCNVESIRMGTEAIEEVYGVPRDEITVFWVPERVARGDFHEDILEANRRFGTNYQAVYLDENTAHDDWFGYEGKWDGIEYNEVKVDLDSDEWKFHEYNGLKISFLDRFSQKWKVETMGGNFFDCAYERSPMIGLRARLLDAALHADQQQVIVCMEDWEDWAGAAYRAAPTTWNPDNFDIVGKYLGGAPWIHVTTITDILAGDVDTNGDEVGDQWGSVYDEPLLDNLPDTYGLPWPPYWLQNMLPITSYTWVRDASEGNYGNDNAYPSFNIDEDPRNDDWDDGYHQWVYGSDAEESFVRTVPLLRGRRYFDKNAVLIPSGKMMNMVNEWNHDGTEQPATQGIIPESWLAIENSTGDEGLLELARYTFMCMNYETAWHDEITPAALTGDRSLNDTQAVLVSWLHPLMGKIRDTVRYVHAADWAASNPGPATVAEQVDVDLDGEMEYILRNDKLYAIFENDGGRLTNLYQLHPTAGAISLIGAGPTNPDYEGEEEATDRWTSNDPDSIVRRITAFRDEDYVNDLYGMSISGNRLIAVSSDLKVKRFVTLEDGADYLDVRYDVDQSLGQMNVQFGISPHLYDLIHNGKENLSPIGCAGCGYAGFENAEGGRVFVTLEDGEAQLEWHEDITRDNTLALTARMVISGERVFRFKLGVGEPPVDSRPQILAGGYRFNQFSSSLGGTLTGYAVVNHINGLSSIDRVEVSFLGTSSGYLNPPAYLMDAVDDGTSGDALAGDGIFTFELPLPAGIPADEYILGFQAFDTSGNASTPWPYARLESVPVLAPPSAPTAPVASHVSTSKEAMTRDLGLMREDVREVLFEQLASGLPQRERSASAHTRSGGAKALWSGYLYDSSDASTFSMTPWVYVENGHLVDRMEMYFLGQPLGLMLTDDGTGGDLVAGDGVFMTTIDLPYQTVPVEFVIEYAPVLFSGTSIARWPYITFLP